MECLRHDEKSSNLHVSDHMYLGFDHYVFLTINTMPGKKIDACLIQDFPWQEVQTPSFAESSEDSMK